MNNLKKLHIALKNKTLVLDGAMGSLIQSYKLSENIFRGKRFAKHNTELKGNIELLSITQPQIIEAIHRKYLEAGADIIETNTFNANLISMEDYNMHKYDLVYEINFASAKIARKLCDEFSKKETDKFRFVAGTLGPTNKTITKLKNSIDTISFKDVVLGYTPQIKGLLDGGVDIILIETIFDILIAKAALFVIQNEEKKRNIKIPIMLSGTINDKNGKMLSGQTIEDFINSFSKYNLLSIGLNCSLGKNMLPYIKKMTKKTNSQISAHPNAGIPDKYGEYKITPYEFAFEIKQLLNNSFINIIGGCCGTTPLHISEIVKLI